MTDADDAAVDWRMIGRAIYQRRAELGMKSQQALADAAHVHVNTIGRIERGVPSSRRNPTWPAIESALRWPAGYISGLADGDTNPLPTVELIPESAAPEISRAVMDAITDGGPDMTARQARQIADGTIEILRRRGHLPPDTAGLT
jgi:DNA-binding XRE family transcriptional regulator